MSTVMFDEIMKELSSLISENDLHVSQVGSSVYFAFFQFYTYTCAICYFNYQTFSKEIIL